MTTCVWAADLQSLNSSKCLEQGCVCVCCKSNPHTHTQADTHKHTFAVGIDALKISGRVERGVME